MRSGRRGTPALYNAIDIERFLLLIDRRAPERHDLLAFARRKRGILVRRRDDLGAVLTRFAAGSRREVLADVGATFVRDARAVARADLDRRAAAQDGNQRKQCD